MSCENKINFLRVRIISYAAYVLRSSAARCDFSGTTEVYCECLSTHTGRAYGGVINVAGISLPDTPGEDYTVFRGNVNK